MNEPYDSMRKTRHTLTYLQVCRENKSFSQRQLSWKSGVAAGLISQMERPEILQSPPSWRTAQALAEALSDKWSTVTSAAIMVDMPQFEDCPYCEGRGKHLVWPEPTVTRPE